MKRYLVIGAGMQGVAAGYFLANYGDGKVFFMDIDVEKAKAAAERVNELLQGTNDLDGDYYSHNIYEAQYIFEPREIDSNDERTNKLIASYHGVFSAATFKINLELTKLCANNNVDMVDLGGNSEVVEQQMKVGSWNATIVPDSGLAPGLGNILAQMIQDESGATDISILCGGIPEIGSFNLADPLKYKLVFSYEGLINEYFEPVRNLQNNQIVIEDGFSGLDSDIVMKFGDKIYELEAFYTSGGTTLAPDHIRRYPSNYTAKNYVYKTLRYRGHRDAFAEMYHGGREEEIKQLIDNPEWKDIILLRVQGKKDGQIVQEINMKVTECPVTGFSAMAQATAYPAAFTLILAVSEHLETGILTPDLAFCQQPDLVRQLLDAIGLDYDENKMIKAGHVQDMFGP